MREIMSSSTLSMPNQLCGRSRNPNHGYGLYSGHGCFYHFVYLGALKEPMRKHNKRYDLNSVFISENRVSCYRPMRWRDRQMNLWFGPLTSIKSVMVGSFESGLVRCEDGGDSMVLKEEGFDGKKSSNCKTPTWGKVSRGSALECRDINVPVIAKEATIHAYKPVVHFLEERNEEVLSKRILTLSRSNKVRSALELLRSMELSGLKPNVHACNSLLSCFLRNSRLEDALRIFNFMKKNGVTTGHTYSLVLKAIAEGQGCAAALDFFEKMESECKVRKDMDVVVYNTIISVCGKANSWIQAEKIWKRMKENGKIGTAVTYRLLVCKFVRCGQNDLAIDAYLEMIKCEIKPAEDAMHAVIGACAKEGNCDLALTVFYSMVNDGLKPNLIACNAVINVLGKDGKLRLAFEVFNVMKSIGYAPDTYTWNALLGALCRANKHADALRLFDKIEENSLHNLQLYNTALMSCQGLGLWERGIQLLWQMEASELSVPTASYNLVIGACGIARKPEVALQVYEHMVDKKCMPDTFTYLSLIRCCISGSLWTEVEEILETAPNASLYNAAIHGMCSSGKTESAKKLYMRMREIGLSPDGKTRAMILQKLARDSYRRNTRPSNQRERTRRHS